MDVPAKLHVFWLISLGPEVHGQERPPVALRVVVHIKDIDLWVGMTCEDGWILQLNQCVWWSANQLWIQCIYGNFVQIEILKSICLQDTGVNFLLFMQHTVYPRFAKLHFSKLKTDSMWDCMLWGFKDAWFEIEWLLFCNPITSSINYYHLLFAAISARVQTPACS